MNTTRRNGPRHQPLTLSAAARLEFLDKCAAKVNKVGAARFVLTSKPGAITPEEFSDEMDKRGLVAILPVKVTEDGQSGISIIVGKKKNIEVRLVPTK